jgi:hypothetical protein
MIAHRCTDMRKKYYFIDAHLFNFESCFEYVTATVQFPGRFPDFVDWQSQLRRQSVNVLNEFITGRGIHGRTALMTIITGAVESHVALVITFGFS